MKRPRQRTSYAIHRAATGRLASGMDRSDPDKGLRKKVHQVQNIPKKLRDAFVSDPGYRMIGGDYVGIEWAIAIWYCAKYNDPPGFHEDLLERFRKGLFDPHRYLASFAFSVIEAKVLPDQRKICKGYTHGRMFDGSPIGLARSVGHTQATGHKVCDAHDRAFQTHAFKEGVYEDACKNKYVQTPLGWRRYFWGYKPKKQEVLGTLVQATAADLCKYVGLEIMKSLPPWAELLTTTHDSFLLQVEEARTQEGLVYLKDTMEMPIPWLDGRSWRADVQDGANWREVS